MKRLLLVTLVGCTFGGSSEDPSIEIELVRDSGVDASIDASVSVPTRPIDSGTDARGTRPVDASVDAYVMEPMPSSCEPAVPSATCDPVHNTDCPPLTQCDIDPEQATPTGRCVFASLPAEQCSSDFLGTTCAPQFACVQSSCHKLCYCDSDCADGQRCSETVGAFKFCL